MTTDVVIVGAGPTGLTLAIDLGRRGVRCLVVERKPGPQFLPKMERCNARSMEMFRRMGLADRIRAAGLRSDVPMDVFVGMSMQDRPLLHLKYPSVDEARAQIAASTDGSQPLEPYQLISQYTLEPLLLEAASSLPSVSFRFGCEFESLTQDAAGVTATVREAGLPLTVTARYLVGCDGGSSAVRRHLGIALRGEGNILQLQQALYHAPDLFTQIPMGRGPGRGRHYHIVDPEASFLIMQDSTEHWTLHARVDRPEDMAAQFQKVVGRSVRFEMLHAAPWKLNLLLAERYRAGRVFLAGDAVHLVIPTGGLGMNSGVGDAVDLGWKLAGTLGGWAGPQLLDSYELERRPIGDRNIGASRHAFLGRRAWRQCYRPEVHEDTPAGAAARAHLAAVAAAEQPKSNDMIGAELGYRYWNSPVIADEPGGPEHRYIEYRPTTWPGARLPHVWLEGHVAVQDLIGDGYTLLRLGRTRTETSGLESALRATGAPLQVLDIPDAVARDVYGYDLLLLRPDMHVAWRGQVPPDDPAALAALVTGHPRP